MSATQDTDDDFLPDVVEWASLSSAQHADTDNDGYPDLVEFVQRSNPRRVTPPRDPDHEMRAIVTSREVAGGGHEVALHVFFRFLGPQSLLTNFQTWLELGVLPGVRFPLDHIGTGVDVAHRVVSPQETWSRVTISLASEQAVRFLLPCTIGVDATIGTKTIQSTAPLFDVNGTTASLVPFTTGKFAIQSIGVNGAFTGTSNRVCVLDLRALQNVPGGTAYVVTHAECEDCNDLECGTACPLTEGWIFVLPGGLTSITGG